MFHRRKTINWELPGQKDKKGKEDMLEIKTISEETPYTFALVGRLDTNTAPQLEEFTSALYAQHIKDIVVDMGKCEFVSSAGLRIIVGMQKYAINEKGSLKFKDVVPEVMDVFDMTGFCHILTFV